MMTQRTHSFALLCRAVLILSVAVPATLVATVAPAAIVNVNQFAAVFPTVTTTGSQFTLANDDVSSTAPDAAVGLSVSDLTVDLTGWNPVPVLGTADSVSIVSGQVTLTGSSGSATFDVASISLTQIINSPIAVGFLELQLTNLVNSSLQDGNGDDVVLNSNMIATVTINGLKITTNGTDGNATIPTLSTASLTAVPEPSSIILGMLGFLGLGLVALGRWAS